MAGTSSSIVIDIGSRKRGEFERRTAIFEGAFRAWSHLGGLAPEDIIIGSSSRTATELDPLDHPLVDDPRATGNTDDYPCETLPRIGLAHPFVRAILCPWLGTNADPTVRKRGLDTLRTWWQHRRSGPSRTALVVWRKMPNVVDGYTRLFFRFAHCIVVHEQATPPPSLHIKMKELAKQRQPGSHEQQQPPPSETLSRDDNNEYSLDAVVADLSNPDLTVSERLQIVERKIQESSTGINRTGASSPILMNLRDGICVLDNIDFLPVVVAAIDRHNQASALAQHRSGAGIVVATPDAVTSSGSSSGIDGDDSNDDDDDDNSTTPVVYCNSGGNDVMIAMTVDGIVCAHCVKIVESVLRGCGDNNSNKSPIAGLIDAVVTDHHPVSTVLIKIDQAQSARRIAQEAARNLRLVGYVAVAKTIQRIVVAGTPVVGSMLGHEISGGGADAVATALIAVGTDTTTERRDDDLLFDWTAPCTCPGHGTFLREDCPRHSQMNHTRILTAFAAREQHVHKYMMAVSDDGDDAINSRPVHRRASLIQLVPGTLDPTTTQQQDWYFPPPPPPPKKQPIGRRDSSLSRFSIGSINSSCRLRASMERVASYGRRDSGRCCSEGTIGSAMSMTGVFDLGWDNVEDDSDLYLDNCYTFHSQQQQPEQPNRQTQHDDERTNRRRCCVAGIVLDLDEE
jgi:hypothetical protein